MRSDNMCAKRSTVGSLMAAYEREVTGLYVTPDSFMTFLGLKRVVKVAQRNQVAWSVCATLCDRLHVVHVQFESGRAASHLTARVVLGDDDCPEVLPERRISGPVVEYLQYALVALGQYCSRVVKVAKFRFDWRWVNFLPIVAAVVPFSKFLLVLGVLVVTQNQEDCRQCEKTRMNKEQQQRSPTEEYKGTFVGLVLVLREERLSGEIPGLFGQLILPPQCFISLWVRNEGYFGVAGLAEKGSIIQ